MEVQLTPDQQAFVRQAIETGRLQREEDAVREALFLWEERERRRMELLHSITTADASLGRGEGRLVSSPDQVTQLADAIKCRGAARLAEENQLA